MRKRYLVGFLLLLNNLANAETFQTDKFKLETSQNGDALGIDFEYSFHIKEHILAEFEYETNKYDSVEDFSIEKKNIKGKNGTKIDESNIAIYFGYEEHYENFNFSMGVGYEQFTRDKEQLGYYQRKDDYIPYNNFIKLKGNQFNLKGDIDYRATDKFNITCTAILTPQTKLDIEQETKFFPNNTKDGNLKSDATFNFSYKINSKINFKINNEYSISLDGSYGFVPYEYQLKVKKGDSFEEKTKEYNEVRTEYYIEISKYIVLKKDKNSLRTYIGYGKEKIDKDGDNISKNLVKIGIEKCF